MKRSKVFGVALGTIWGIWSCACSSDGSTDEEGAASMTSMGGSGSANSGDVGKTGTSSTSVGESSSSSESSDEDTGSGSGTGSESGEPAFCEDGYACVAAPPSNWAGPIVRMEGLNVEILPACGGNYPLKQTDLYGGVQFDPASCTQCECGKPLGVSCSGIEVNVYEQTNCQEPVAASGVVGPDDECKNFVVNSDNGVSWQSKLAEADLSMATCSPSGGFPSVEDASWGYGQRLCASVPNSRVCPAEQTCVPTEIGKGKPGLCVYQAGDRVCPDEIYTFRTVLYTEVIDARSCSACECGKATGDYKCDAGIVGYLGSNCADGQSDSIAIPGESCEELDFSGQVARSGRLVIDTDSIQGEGRCDPAGGLPMGEVTPSMPVTLCCTL